MSIIDRVGRHFDGYIEIVTETDIQGLSKKWQFDWSKIHRADDLTFKLVKDDAIHGLLRLEWENDAYIIMKNVEVSPDNFGARGQYINIAALLVSFACYQSFKMNTGDYIGYLAFTSKSNLIQYYNDKYGAELVFRERMIIPPEKSLKLIAQHLNLNLIQ